MHPDTFEKSKQNCSPLQEWSRGHYPEVEAFVAKVVKDDHLLPWVLVTVHDVQRRGQTTVDVVLRCAEVEKYICIGTKEDVSQFSETDGGHTSLVRERVREKTRDPGHANDLVLWP